MLATPGRACNGACLSIPDKPNRLNGGEGGGGARGAHRHTTQSTHRQPTRAQQNSAREPMRLWYDRCPPRAKRHTCTCTTNSTVPSCTDGLVARLKTGHRVYRGNSQPKRSSSMHYAKTFYLTRSFITRKRSTRKNANLPPRSDTRGGNPDLHLPLVQAHGGRRNRTN